MRRGFLISPPSIRQHDAVARGLRREFRNATCGTLAVRNESMRAETQNLVEEIKQSVRLLRRHL